MLINGMRLFEIEFMDTSTRIVFAKNRQAIWKKYSDIYEIHAIEII